MTLSSASLYSVLLCSVHGYERVHTSILYIRTTDPTSVGMDRVLERQSGQDQYKLSFRYYANLVYVFIYAHAKSN